jgi:hypothetical protein
VIVPDAHHPDMIQKLLIIGIEAGVASMNQECKQALFLLKS